MSATLKLSLLLNLLFLIRLISAQTFKEDEKILRTIADKISVDATFDFCNRETKLSEKHGFGAILLAGVEVMKMKR